MKNRNFITRLGFAYAGLIAAFRRERSFRTHLIFAALAALALVILRPAPVWWALVAVVVALVLAMELVNSAIEAVIDLLHPERHEEIRAAKDMVAGAVLLISLAALIVALSLVIEQVPRLGWFQGLCGEGLRPCA
jgi:diacylglycerol kinase (ATP)